MSVSVLLLAVLPVTIRVARPESASAGAAIASPGMVFAPVSSRLADTRQGATPAPVAADATLPVQVAGVAGVPADAGAVVLNVTITETTAPGFVSVVPRAAPLEPPAPLPVTILPYYATSSLNADRAGQTRANQVTVAVGHEGMVDVYTQGGAHVIVDLVGYYRQVTTSDGSTRAGRFRSAKADRLEDLRRSERLAAGTAADFVVAGRSGVPNDVTAVVVNLTAVNMTEPGFVVAYPAGSARPETSNVNVDRAGGTAANLVTVPVSASGAISVWTLRETALIVDLIGWYTGATAESSTNGMFQVADGRAYDSRNATKFPGNTTRSIPLTVLTTESLTEAVLVNTTLVDADAAGFATIFATGSGRPGTSTINTDAGQTRANAAIVQTNGGVSLFVDPPSHAIVDLAGVFISGDGSSDVGLQLLSFNDYHGHLQPPGGSDANLGAFDPTPATPTPVGGGEYLATALASLRASADHSLTATAGDLIGGTPFLSGLFRDEPSVESLEAMGLDVSGVGNHEFDEGLGELLRMQYGGCHPTDGCFFPSAPYDGASFPWLAANVFRTSTGQTVLPPTWVKEVSGIKVGFIGMTLEDTPVLVAQNGIVGLEFRDEVVSANAAAAALDAQGVKAIVVLLHEGGIQTGKFGECTGISGPIVAIAQGLDAKIDMVVTGHTHQPYICSVNDPAGNKRMVTSASSFGRVVTETRLTLKRSTGDVDRSSVTSTNRLVVRTAAKNAQQTAIIAKWNAKSAPVANRVVGTIAADLLRSPNRDTESALANLIADAQLSATKVNGAQIALMNPGGVRADLKRTDIAGGEQVGEVTFGESFTVQPFGNLLVTINMTGAQIEQVLEQQFVTARPGGRDVLVLGVSQGLEFAYSLTAANGNRIDPASIKLNGTVIDPAATYKVTVNNFLADGGDSFSVFAAGTNRVGGGEDLAAFNAYLKANSPVASPGTNRITELP